MTMTLKPHQCTKKKLHAKLNKMCHTYFIASFTLFFFFPTFLKKLRKIGLSQSRVWHSTTSTSSASSKMGVLWQVRRATKRNKCNQRHNSLKRQRTEAPWNFTKNPLGVTKVLTIPWEFKQNQKENIPRLKIDCKSSSRTTAHLSHCFQINCCIKWGSSTCVKAFYCTCISLVGRRCTLLNYFHKEPLDGGQLGAAFPPFPAALCLSVTSSLELRTWPY